MLKWVARILQLTDRNDFTYMLSPVTTVQFFKETFYSDPLFHENAYHKGIVNISVTEKRRSKASLILAVPVKERNGYAGGMIQSHWLHCDNVSFIIST